MCASIDIPLRSKKLLRLNSFGFVLVFHLIFGVCICFGDALNDWTWRNPLPQGGSLNRIYYGNAEFVAQGSRTLTSKSGTSWSVSTQQSGLPFILGFAGGIYVGTSSGSILTSIDGKSWTTRVSGLRVAAIAMAFGNNSYVVVGSSGSNQGAVTSSDGVSWSEVILGAGYPLYAVTFGSGTFVAVGSSGTIMTSPDGVTWISQVSGTTYDFKSVTYGNGVFVAAGAASSFGGTIYTSPDGSVWTKRSIPACNVLRGVVYGDGRFVSVGDYFVTNSSIITSTNGTVWESHHAGPSSGLGAIAFGDGKYVAVGTGGLILVSNDATNWASQQYGSKIISKGIIFAKDIFVAVGWSDNLVTSSNGVDWLVRASSSSLDLDYNFLSAVTYGDGKFIAAGHYVNGPSNIFYLSTDGVNWAKRPGQFSTSGVTVSTIAYGNGLFVAGSSGGTYLTSPDGTNWTLRTTALGAYFNELIYTNGIFVAACGYGQIVTSTDGIGWVNRFTGVSQHLNGVTFAQGLFVCVGDACIVLTSPNGTTWTKQNVTSDSYPFFSVAFAAGNFLIPSDYGFCWVSTNATNWTRRTLLGSPWFRKFASDGNTLVGVDDINAILQSGFVAPNLTGQAEPGGFRLTLSGGIAQGASTSVVYQVQKSSDLVNWAPLVSLTNSQASIQYLDSTTTNTAQRFYRAVAQ